jgi:hypothetical protein
VESRHVYYSSRVYMSRRTRSRLTFVRLYPFYGMSVRLFLPPMIVRGSRNMHAGVSRDLVLARIGHGRREAHKLSAGLGEGRLPVRHGTRGKFGSRTWPLRCALCGTHVAVQCPVRHPHFAPACARPGRAWLCPALGWSRPPEPYLGHETPLLAFQERADYTARESSWPKAP